MYQSRDGAGVYDIQLDAPDASERGSAFDQSIVFPDKELLFTAAFKRAGADLILTGENNKTAIIFDYFRDDRRLNIVTPEGAGLTGDVIAALAGSEQPERYAQATPATATYSQIGRVEKVSGSATVLRNGVPVELHLGDFVAKGDVVQTGSDSAVTIKFTDGTVFGLSSSARIVLNEMVYAADGEANSALITLVQGIIGFVAGRVAKTGDMKVATPVATMAIRGTAVQTEISASSGTTKFSLLTEPDGSVGSFLLLDRLNPSRVLAAISSSGVATIITPTALSEVRIAQVAKTPDDIRNEGEFARNLFQIFSTEPRQRRGSSDIDGIAPVLENAFQSGDLLDHTQFAANPYFDKPAALPPVPSLPFEQPAPIRFRAIATEDGPAVSLGRAAVAVDQGPGPLSLAINLPSSLPPGVEYLENAGKFALDPTHPAYQRLAAGETLSVTVSYSFSGPGLLIPASVSWIVKGRNDAPIARSDSFSGVSERGKTVLAVVGNDSDIDGDAMQVIHWTQPLEGFVALNPKGGLTFDPGNEFHALSAGETATVSFDYTVTDGHGGMDTATATVQIRGAGTFSAPKETTLAEGVLAFNGQPVSLTLAAPSQTTASIATLDLSIALGPILQPQMNILYVADISGSALEAFAGTPVGDLNQDGRANSILDAEIANLANLTDRIRGLGFSPADVTVTVIPFNSSADPAAEEASSQNAGNTMSVTFSLGGTGDQTIANFLNTLNAGGGTNFESALSAAVEKLQVLDQGGEKNIVYFLSDGIGGGSFEDEIATLNDRHEAKIVAVGIGANADISLLNAIDNTGGAETAISANQLDTSILGLPLASGEVVDLDVFINGVQIEGIGLDDLASTTNGLALQTPISGLTRKVGDTNTVSATVTFASGEVLKTKLDIAGALPLSTDLLV